MPKTNQHKLMKDAILTRPNLLDDLDDFQKDIVTMFFVDELTAEQITTDLNIEMNVFKNTLSAAKRRIYLQCLETITDKTELEVNPLDIWKNENNMRQYLNNWLDIAVIIEDLITEPCEKQRNDVIKSIFDFHKMHQESIKNILNHSYVR